MGTSSDTGCIAHRQRVHYFVIYEDYQDVAKKVSPHWKKLAAFWRVLEAKTNDRENFYKEQARIAGEKGLDPPEAPSLWIEIAYSEMVSWSLETFHESSFQVAAAESERLGFSLSRNLQKPGNPRDPESSPVDYKEYFFLTDVMQKAINEGVYPTPIEINSPLLKSIAVRKEKKAIESNTPPIENNSPSRIRKNRGGIKNNTKKDSNSITSKDDEESKRENPVPPSSPAPTPSVSPSQTDVTTDTFPEDGIPGEQEEEDEGPSTDKRPALRLVPPLHTQLPDKKAQAPERPWGTAACLLLFQEWRGYPLMAPAQKKEASECAHNLAASCSREEVIEVRTYMVEKHDHWKERASSVDVCQVATWFGEMVQDMKLYPEGKAAAKRNGGNGHAPPGTPRTPQSPKLTPLTGKPVPPPPGMLAKAQGQERENRQHGA